jgi:hypothetical protein
MGIAMVDRPAACRQAGHPPYGVGNDRPTPSGERLWIRRRGISATRPVVCFRHRLDLTAGARHAVPLPRRARTGEARYTVATEGV